MSKKQPLYPHIPKSKQPRFPLVGKSSERIVILDATPAMADVVSGLVDRPTTWQPERVRGGICPWQADEPAKYPDPYWYVDEPPAPEWLHRTPAYRRASEYLSIPVEGMVELVYRYPNDQSPSRISEANELVGLGFPGVIHIWEQGQWTGWAFKRLHQHLVGFNEDGTRAAVMLLQWPEA